MSEMLGTIEVKALKAPETDTDICDVARISFSRKAEEFTEEANKKLLNYLAREGHWSPFGHLYLQLQVEEDCENILEILTETEPAGIIVTRLNEDDYFITLSVWKIREIFEYIENKPHLHSFYNSLHSLLSSKLSDIKETSLALFSKYKDRKLGEFKQTFLNLPVSDPKTRSKHTILSFACKVPIFLARQLGKHQINLTWNEESRRYIDSTPQMYRHEFLRARPEKSVKQGSGGKLEDSDETLMFLNEESAESNLKLYEELLQCGVAPEQARSELSQRMLTSYRWTGNVPAFMRVLKQRLYKNAQWEAREFAKLLAKEMLTVLPEGFQERIKILEMLDELKAHEKA
jgi:thymidylate synthase (FAD)